MTIIPLSILVFLVILCIGLVFGLNDLRGELRKYATAMTTPRTPGPTAYEIAEICKREFRAHQNGYTLMVEMRTTYNGKPERFYFGRVGTLDVTQTKHELIMPDVRVTGGRWWLVGPEDIVVSDVRVGNGPQTMGNCQLRWGMLPLCDLGQRMSFEITRRNLVK